MIKYAERGLVSNGLNIDLYNKLFWTSSSIFLFLYHTIIAAVNIKEENLIMKTITGSLCSDPSKPFTLSKYWTENSKNIVIRICFVSFNMGYSSILALAALTSHKIRQVNSYRVKTQIGKFRRNILTLKETVTPMFLVTFMEVIRTLVVQYALTNEDQGEELKKTAYNLILILNLIINDLVLGVILPCIVISNINTEIPESSNGNNAISPESNSFYTRSIEVTPRRDFEILQSPQDGPRNVLTNPRNCPQLPEVEI